LYANGPGSTHGGGADATAGVVADAAPEATDAAGLAATGTALGASLPGCLPYLAVTLSCDLHN